LGILLNTGRIAKRLMGEAVEASEPEMTKKIIGATILTAAVSTLTAKLVDAATNKIAMNKSSSGQVQVVDTDDVSFKISRSLAKELGEAATALDKEDNSKEASEETEEG